MSKLDAVYASCGKVEEAIKARLINWYLKAPKLGQCNTLEAEWGSDIAAGAELEKAGKVNRRIQPTCIEGGWDPVYVQMRKGRQSGLDRLTNIVVAGRWTIGVIN